MAYLHIDNLYKNQKILMFNECYALEKVHGTSAWLSYSPTESMTVQGDDGKLMKIYNTVPSRLSFYAGGGKHDEFVKLFDAEAIRLKLDELTPEKHTIIYGEYYGPMHKMIKTYGDKMRFVAFEVRVGGSWLSVPNAEEICKELGIEFVHYKRIRTNIQEIDAERDAPSEQAKRNGMVASTDKWGFCPPIREGIVLRPIEEMTLNNGDRIIAKHKRDELRETKTPRQVSSEDLAKIEEAKAIADEWVTEERLNHILGRGVEAKIENTGKIIALVTEDILREAEGEIVDSPNARKEIARSTALMFKMLLKQELNERT